MLVCAINTVDGVIYATGRSWAEIRDYARYRYQVTDDDVQHRPEGAPSGVSVYLVTGALSHDERRADEQTSVANAGFVAGWRDAHRAIFELWETNATPVEFVTALRKGAGL
jgi:hypothetical protein